MRFVLFILSCICCMFITACGHTLSSESGLYDVELRQHVKMPIDGVWSWGKGNPYVNKKTGYIYIAPLDISNIAEDEPELAPLMIPQMHDYMVSEFAAILREMNRTNQTNWQLSASPEPANIHIRTALVHFAPQRPWLRVLGKIAEYILPVPGVERAVGVFSKGDICIEASIRDAKSGLLLMAFKDSNQKTTKYDHVIPLLVALEESEKVDGIIILINTLGGDVEAGLAIAEVIASLKTPTVSIPEFTQLDSGKSIMRYFPPYGTAGFAISRVSA